MDSIIYKKDIKEIELELTGICNLNCYICSRNFSISHKNAIKNIRSLNDIILQIEQFINVERIFLAGTYSEPTTYPQFFQLLDYLNKKNIKYYIYTNASIHDEKWWEKLGNIVAPNCYVIFTVCGSNQQLHSYYRVGSKLEDVLKNAMAFRRSGKKNDILQYILFEYNYKDYKMGNSNYIFDQFSTYKIINSEGRRLENKKIKEPPKGIMPINSVNSKINYIFEKSLLYHKPKINCIIHKWKHIYINQFGNIYPCSTLFDYGYQPLICKNNIFFELGDINLFKYKCCNLCSTKIQKLIQTFNLDFVC